MALLYLIDEPGKDIWQGVSTCVRDHALIVNSTITNQPRVFMTSAANESNLVQWSERWSRFAHSFITNRRFDYVVLLGLEQWVVVVIEMRRALESKVLRFHADSAANDGVHWFELRTDRISALRRGFSNPEPDARDFRFGFEPFEAC